MTTPKAFTPAQRATLAFLAERQATHGTRTTPPRVPGKTTRRTEALRAPTAKAAEAKAAEPKAEPKGRK